MKYIFFTLLILFSVNCFSQSPEWDWAKSAGGAVHDEANAVAVDSSGNVYVVGYFSSPSISFGSVSLTNFGGGSRFFMVKYSPTGDVLWAKTTHGNGNSIPKSIALDGVGNIYVAGEFSGFYVAFGNNVTDSLYNTDFSNSTTDLFLAKFDQSGDIIWARSASIDTTSQVGDEYSRSIAVDNDGNSYLVGIFSAPIIFGSTLLTSEGPKNIFFVKYDTNGNVVWAKRSGGSDYDNPNSIALDNTGNLYFTGIFGNQLSFGSITLTCSTPDIFLVKYTTDGNVVWAKNIQGNMYDEATSIAVSNSGDVFITGRFDSSTLNFGTLSVPREGYRDIFIAKFDSDGNAIWAKNAGVTIVVWSTSVAVNNSGDAYITGWFLNDTLVIGSNVMISTGSVSDIFLAKYSSDGDVISAEKISGGSADSEYYVHLDKKGNVLTGSFQGSPIYFGEHSITKVGWKDVFVARFSDVLHAYACNDLSVSCNDTVQLNVTTDYTGTGALSYIWSPSVGLNNNTIPNPVAIVGSSAIFYVTVTSPEGESAIDSVSVNTGTLSTMNICYVEFDMATSRNKIVWGSVSSSETDSIFIYNEVSTNVWSKIGSVSSSSDFFIDNGSNPFNQSYSYKISALDNCSNETDLSNFHTTITLLSMYDSGSDTYGFAWSPYFGLNVANYFIYGVSSTGTETLIASVPGNQYFYNYTNPFAGFVWYFIGFVSNSCSSKEDYLVRSNFVFAGTGIDSDISGGNYVRVFPNPVKEKLFVISEAEILNIEIRDISGRILIVSEYDEISVDDLENGVYFVKMYTQAGLFLQKFVKE